VQVFGPAYLDRVLLVDRPLVSSGLPPIDQSVDGTITFGPGLRFRVPSGRELTVEPPRGWPGPTGKVALGRPVAGLDESWPMDATGLDWHDDLGGMGAGFAAALDGELLTVIGPEDDAMSTAIEERLRLAEIRYRVRRVDSRQADWTLLLSSGPFGDKLPIGFRGCLASLASLEDDVARADPVDLRVVASLPNRLALQVLEPAGARVRLFAPAMRNMLDRDTPVHRFASAIDILCCNAREWESLADREQVAWQLSILSITDGPAGSLVRFTTPEGEPGRFQIPAFPRASPPLDTNRAGEAYAATLVATLLATGWSPQAGVADEALLRRAALRASAAAALVLDRARFGFPSSAEIDAALRAGKVSETGEDEHLDAGYNTLGESDGLERRNRS
jgi:ribokinase